MQNGIHFISGLPRAGSTLLAAVLRQNPRLHANMSGPTGSLFTSLLLQMSGANEFSVFLTDKQRRGLLSAMFESYYAEIHPRQVVFDTNRLWCTKMPALAELYPKAKVIACVRHCSWIMDSIEQLIRRNKFEMSKIFNYDPAGTVYARAETLSRGDNMIGYAWNALKEAYYGEHTANLMLLRYETLVADPASAIKAVYDFIGEKPFQHDFDNVAFDADEFDSRHGTPGLHAVARRIEPKARASILPPDLFRRYENDNFWNDPALNTRGVRVV